VLSLKRLSATSLTIQVINACVRACSDAFSAAGPVLEIGSYYDPSYEDLCDRRGIFPGREFIGCDIRQGPGVDRVEDVENLTLPDGFAGTLLILETLEHLSDPTRAIAECRRVLRDDGLLILSVPFSYRLHGFPTDYWRFTASGVHRLLAGFPRKTILSLGAAVKPMTVFAVASKSDSDGFEAAERLFRGEIERTSAPLRRKLFVCALQERTRDLLGLVAGRARISARFFDESQASKGYGGGRERL